MWKTGDGQGAALPPGAAPYSSRYKKAGIEVHVNLFTAVTRSSGPGPVPERCQPGYGPENDRSHRKRILNVV